MRRIAGAMLLAALIVAWPTCAQAQGMTGAEYGRRSREEDKKQQKLARRAAKKQLKISRKAAKRQRKAMKKYAKAQRKQPRR